MKLYPTIKKMLYPVLDESIKSVFISIDVHHALMIHITSSYILMNQVQFLGFNFYSSLLAFVPCPTISTHRTSSPSPLDTVT
jgi:hypothetical protein